MLRTWEAPQPPKADKCAIPRPEPLATLDGRCCQLHFGGHVASAADCAADLLSHTPAQTDAGQQWTTQLQQMPQGAMYYCLWDSIVGQQCCLLLGVGVLQELMLSADAVLLCREQLLLM
jgi:hypothetical protein